MKQVQNVSKLVIALAASLPFLAIAQSGPAKPQYEIGGNRTVDEDAGRGISLMDGVSFYPFAKFGYGRDDNMFLSGTNKTKSDLTLFNGGGTLEARRQNQTYTFLIDGKLGNYRDSSADNYRDLLMQAAGDFVLGTRSGLRLGIDYDKGHDPRGSTDRALAATPDVYRNVGWNALYAFGANDARGRLELGISSFNKRYQNNGATTFLSDRDTDEGRVAFYLKVLPKTSLLAEYREAKFDYISSASAFDSKEKRAMLGVTWDATAATTGTFKVGRLKKEFSSSAIADFSGSNWEGNVEWRPLTYTKVNFFTVKTIAESTGLGNFILSKRTGAAWTHAWNSRITSTASYTFVKDDFQGGGTTRRDETDTLGFKINYKLGRNLTLGADYTRADRDSNQAGSTYKRNQFMVSLGAKL
jgi:polysaccharide biosynthesis protein VpsM